MVTKKFVEKGIEDGCYDWISENIFDGNPLTDKEFLQKGLTKFVKWK